VSNPVVMCYMVTHYRGQVPPEGMFVLREIILDDKGYDKHGWYWGLGKRLFHLMDKWESLTVRADSYTDAMNIIMAEGWPPKRSGRFNWGREILNADHG